MNELKLSKEEITALNTLSKYSIPNFLKSQIDPFSTDDRDFRKNYGYLESPDYTSFYHIYKRSGIGNVIVAKVAKSCWRDVPKIKIKDKVILEDEINKLVNIGLFKYLERVDILNRIGKYSTLLIGLPDGRRLNEELGKAGNYEKIYFRSYSENSVTISSWNADSESIRYGLPELYQLRVMSEGDKQEPSIENTRIAHHSRVVHFAEGSLDNEIEGASSLEPVLDAIFDLTKTRGAAAESFYRNARQKFALEVDKEAQLDNSAGGVKALKDEVEAFTNNLQDFMRLKNMKATVMQPKVEIPRHGFDMCLEEISGQTGIPLRILTGKGGGQMAGNEDKASWNALVADRQSSFCTEKLTECLKLFAKAGYFELPEGFEIEWPQQSALSETEKTEVNHKKAETVKTIVDAVESSTINDIDIKTVFDACDLDDIEFSEVNLDDVIDDDDLIDDPTPKLPEGDLNDGV